MACDTRTLTMARPKGRPKLPITAPPRGTLLNLKGTDEQIRWFDDIHFTTRIGKSSLMRLALTFWAERHGLPPFPQSVEDTGLAEFAKKRARSKWGRKGSEGGGEGE